MRKRSIVAVCLCVLFAALAVSGCSLKPKEKVELIIKTPPLATVNGSDSGVDEAYQLLENAAERFCEQYDEADVSVKVVKFDYVDEDKYITGCFDTENAADVLFEGYFNMASYIYSGRVVPLDDILTDELKADFSEATLELSRVNGKTYMLPFYSLQNTMCYNKDLFKACGLDKYIADEGVIENWKLEEWEEILNTLAEKLTDVRYPMMMYAKNNQGDTHIMTLLRSHGCPLFDDDNYLCVNTPEGIEALEWIAKGEDRGYFPKGAENLELADCMTLFNNGQLAINMTNNAFFPDMDHRKYGLVNFPSKEGKGYSTSFVTGFMVFDNNNEAKLKAAKDFVSYFYGRGEFLDYEMTGIPANKSVTQKFRDEVYMLDAYGENSETAVKITGNNPNWQGVDGAVRNIFWKHIHELLAGEIKPEECAKLIDDECNAAILLGRKAGKLHE